MGFLNALVVGVFIGVILTYLLRQVMSYRSRQRRALASDVAFLSRMDLGEVAKICGGVSPGWVSFPEFERTAWINEQLREIWPFVNKATSSMIRTVVEPLLEEHRPLGILAMKFTKLTLGDIPPQIAGIKMRTLKAGQLTLDVQLQWGGEPIIRLGVQPAISPSLLPIQFGDLQVFTTARIILELTGEVPVIGAVVVALLADPKPKISYSLKLVGGSLTAIPGLADLIDDLIQDSLEDTVVWPKRIVVPLIPGYPTEHLELRIEGKLRVTVVGATGLKNDAIIGTSDPYVSLWTRTMFHKKTKTVNNNLNPKWGETFEFLVEDFHTTALIIKVLDESNLQLTDPVLGTTSIPIDELVANHMEEKTVWLLPALNDPHFPRSRDAGRGSISLQLSYHPFNKEEQDAAMAKEKNDLLVKKKSPANGVIGGTANLAMGTVTNTGKFVGSAVGSGAKIGLTGLSSIARFATATRRSRSSSRN